MAAVLHDMLLHPPLQRQQQLSCLAYWESQGLAESVTAAWTAPTVIERITATVIETDAGRGYLAIAQARSRARRVVPA
jgi:hypothetical protein